MSRWSREGQTPPQITETKVKNWAWWITYFNTQFTNIQILLALIIVMQMLLALMIYFKK